MKSLPALLLLAGCTAAPLPQGGIVSTNPCADALLVQLAPERLAAVSHWSHEESATSLPLSVARRWPATASTAEEVIARRPDLVVTDTFAPAATRAAYAQAGLRVLTLDSPTTVAASLAQVRQVAAAVGQPARGEALARRIETSLTPPTSRRPAALMFISGDLTTGSGTLLDELLARAGFRNAAATYGLAYTGTLPAETIAARPPAVIIATGAGRQAAARAAVLRGVPTASFDRRLVNCAGPTIPAALARLRAIRAHL